MSSFGIRHIMGYWRSENTLMLVLGMMWAGATVSVIGGYLGNILLALIGLVVTATTFSWAMKRVMR